MQELYDGYVAMQVHGVTRGVSLRDAFIVVLKERDSDSCFPLLVDEAGFDKVTCALRERNYDSVRLAQALAARLGLSVAGVRVLRPNRGAKESLVDYLRGEELVSLSVPTGDALVLALQSRCVIYLSSSDYRGQQLSDSSMALPMAAMSDKLLHEAIDGAVKADNFELACVLRDELRRRESAAGSERI